MAGIQVVNLQKVEGAGGNLGKHIDGERRPKTAVPRLGIPAVTHLDEEGKELTDGVKAAKKRATNAGTYIADCRNRKYEVTRNGQTVYEGVRGRKADPCAAFLFAGPPPYGDAGAWDQPKIRAWAATCIKWALDKGGKGVRIAHCALHQDEKSPHLHLVLVAADGMGRLGWNRIQRGFGTGKERGPELMSAMQTSFHNEVGKAYGLDRGEVGSTAKRQPIDREEGLAARVDEERKRADEGIAAAEEGRAAAEERAAAVVKRADEDATGRVQAQIDRLGRELGKAKTASDDAKAEVLNLKRTGTNLTTVRGERNNARHDRDEALKVRDELQDELQRVAETAAKEQADAVRTAVKAADERAATARTEADAAVKAADERAATARTEADAAVKAADERAATARTEADAAVEAAATAGERVGELETSLAAQKRELEGVPQKINDAVWEAVMQVNRDWQPVIEQKVEEEKQRGADALEGAEQAARDADEDRDAARGERDQARGDLKTRTTERNNARTTRDQALEQVETVKADRNAWIERFVEVLRDLNPGRAELDRAADRAGIKKQWLAQEVGTYVEQQQQVERGRGGMDR